jgi:hypothetical protein
MFAAPVPVQKQLITKYRTGSGSHSDIVGLYPFQKSSSESETREVSLRDY